MKRFLHKTVTYALFLFGVAVAIWLLKGNKVYSSSYLESKLEYLKTQPKYNTVFIGSSKINNQVNPTVIDSVANGIKSYNLGANASFNLENFNTIDLLLNNENLKLKVIVLELQNKVKFTKENLSSERSFTSLSYDNLIFLLKYQFEEKSLKQILFTLYSTLLNVFYLKEENGITQDSYIEKFIFSNGFFPLDKDKNQEVKKRKADLVKSPTEINRRLDAYNKDQNTYQVNTALVAKLEDINKKCASKNIKLILLISAPAEPDAKQLLPYQNIKELPVINMSNPNEYPEFYNLENRWDYGHLNEKGANIYSNKLAEKLNLILKN